MIALVAVSIIPELIIPSDDGGNAFIKKEKNYSAPQNYVAERPQTDCALAPYGMDCALAAYLEKNLALAPVKNGRNFCSYEIIGASESGDVRYVNYLCEEYYFDNRFIRQGSGQAGPAKIILLDNGSLIHWVPRDGSYFTRDLNEFFPPEYLAAAQNPKSEKLAQINRQRAKNDFNADFEYKIEKETAAVCRYDFECATPGEYLAQSRCPFTSVCLNGQCAVVCPSFPQLDL